MMLATLFLSALLCSLATAERRLRDGIDPADLVREIIDESNDYVLQHHLDSASLPVIEYDGFLHSFQLFKGQAGNFSSAVLVGNPTLNMTDQPGGFSVCDFDMDVGMADITITAQFKAKLLGLLSFSGTLSIINSGNAVRALGAVVSYSDSKTHGHNCTVDINSLKLLEVGKVHISIGPGSIAHWILEKLSSLVLYVAHPLVAHVVEHTISKVAQMDEVKQIIDTIMCRYF